MTAADRPVTSIFLSTVPAYPAESQLATPLIFLLGVAFLAAAPFANLRAGQVPAC